MRPDVTGCARGKTPRAVPVRTARAVLAALFLVPQLTGCYTYVPLDSSARPVGTHVSVGITDRGRVALAPQVGPEVRRLNGRVLQNTDSALVLSVASVRYLEAAASERWTGERVQVSRDFLSEVAERRLSPGRTALAGGLFAAAVVVISAVSLTVLGGDDQGSTRTPLPPPTQQ
jgi:hypothetical protein